MSDQATKQVNVLTENLFRHEGARLVATLTSHLGVQHLQLAEDVVQEALVRALQAWPYRGVPDNPAAWLTQVAKNLALDHLRREQRWNTKQDSIAAEQERWLSNPVNELHDTFTDDTLRMMFVCFHPQLSTEAQTALALRTLCGLSPAEIAAAFLTSEAAIAKRLVRARQLIRDLALPFAVPEPSDLPERLDGVLGTLYLLFNEGYKASSGDRLVREDLCHEAIRLVTLLAEHPSTQAPRTFALLALMHFNAARLSARTDDVGNLLRLHEQNRAAWDQAMIYRGIECLGRAAQGDTISQYHLEAGIAACHSTAPDDASTNWPRILALYDQLITLTSSPIAAMNRAVAVARVQGPQAGMDALDAITDRSKLEAYHLFHVIRGTFAAELGSQAAALAHFRQAGNLASLPAERDFIARRIEEVGGQKREELGGRRSLNSHDVSTKPSSPSIRGVGDGKV
ncbi:MAG: sigma-70 family RNA polymerase sigma factor [Verrucomicrobiales bacterium]|nr:sigma-70 family RNA polymerase sigma factor [Verrucomicrobiales bacterium]MCP5556154.1 sigma-70 family RNA polymerase sigma factor [Verrucomicrobiaceae bacterium]